MDKLKYTVLFIEDEQEIRNNYIRYLKRHYEDVYEAIDGEEGYAIYKAKSPDIMIVDINLPKLSGLDLVQKIRKIDQKVKVIMLTAYSDTKYLLQATELKLVKYLVKPITRDELKLALDIAINEFSEFNVVSKKVIRLKDSFSWDCELNKMYSNDVEVNFTNKEQKIMKLFFSSPDNVFTYDDIIMEVWDNYEESKLDPLKTMIKNIRKKLPKDTIKNVFGVGYKF